MFYYISHVIGTFTAIKRYYIFHFRV